MMLSMPPLLLAWRRESKQKVCLLKEARCFIIDENNK